VSIGESWELADLPETIPEGRSRIRNGELAGMTLHQAIARHRDLIVGDARLTAEGGFPLLIKYLDARENLSVQVHPDHAYVARHPDAHLKSEAWVVVKSRPHAVIYKGVKPKVTAEQFTEGIRAGTAVDDLNAVPVKPGDCHYLPSGTCHALGAGIVVAEIQTPSDTTFRVYDWGRTAVPGNPARELHLDQAMQCIHFGELLPPQRLPGPIEVRGVRTTALAQTEYFQIERLDALTMARFSIVTSGLPEVWMLISGSGRIEYPNAAAVELAAGTTVLIPAALTDATAVLARGSWALRIKLPSPLKGMIA
jgi:mannose-6-phosphate isomerase